jgi:hypothetical protein
MNTDGRTTMDDRTELLWLTTPVDDAIAFDGGAMFWKELIRPGDWTNAKAGFTLNVDANRLAAWKANFDAMADAGIRVPVPWGHSYDPRDNAGFVEKIELRDGGLWGRLHVPDDDDAAKLGTTVRGVSVSINPHFVDGSGRDWGEVIEHVALTNYPVVTDQADFVQAEHGGEQRAIALERELPRMNTDGHGSEREDRMALAQRQGVEGEDGAAEAIAARFESLTAELASCQSELLELRAEHVDEDTARSPSGPRTPTTDNRRPDPDPRLRELEHERADRDVDDALRLGKFTRPAAVALRRLLDAGVAASYAMDAACLWSTDRSDEPIDLAALAREIIDGTPPGAAVDMSEHTRTFPVPPPDAGMDDAKAARLARENKALAKVL